VSVFLECCEKDASGFIEPNAIGDHPTEKADDQQIESRNNNDEPVFNCAFSVCVIHLSLQSYKLGRASIIVEISELAAAPVYLLCQLMCQAGKDIWRIKKPTWTKSF
jgi:hypothetical protein